MSQAAPKSVALTPTSAALAPSRLQRKCACEGTGETCSRCADQKMGLQRKAEDSTTDEHVPPVVHDVLKSRGQPLDADIRADMEPRFHEDFSNVRVHNDSAAFESARALHAKAFTYGPHIAFSPGRFHTADVEGRALLAHELAHVVQQRRGGLGQTTGLESDAEAASQSVFGTGSAEVRGMSQPHIAREGEEETPWWKRKLTSASQSASRLRERVRSAPGEIKGAVSEQYANAQQTLRTASENVTARLETTKADLTAKLAQVNSKENRAKIAQRAQRLAEPSSPLAQKSAATRLKYQASLAAAQQKGSGLGHAEALNTLVGDVDDFIQAWNRVEVEPHRASAAAWKTGGFGAAVKAGQKSSDDAMKELTGAFKKALGDFDDGKFTPPAKPSIDPNAHPTLAAVDRKALAASETVNSLERQAASGVALALWSMGTGVTTMAVHPINTVKGLGELPGPSGIASFVSPVGAIKTIGQGVGLVDDLATSKTSSGKVVREFGKKQLPSTDRDAEQTKNLVQGIGENYIEAAGYKLEVDPSKSDKTDPDKSGPDKRRIVKDENSKARLGRIPGLLLVDVGSFFIPGGSGSRGAKLAPIAGETAGAVRVAEGLGQIEKVAQAGGGLAKGAEGTGALGKVADVGGEASKAAPLAQEAKGAEQAAAIESQATQGAAKNHPIPLLDDAMERVKKSFGESKPGNDVIPPSPEPHTPTVVAEPNDAAVKGTLLDIPPDRVPKQTSFKFKEGSPRVQSITEAPRPPGLTQEAKAATEALETEEALAELEHAAEIEVPQLVAAGAEPRGTVAMASGPKKPTAGTHSVGKTPGSTKTSSPKTSEGAAKKPAAPHSNAGGSGVPAAEGPVVDLTGEGLEAAEGLSTDQLARVAQQRAAVLTHTNRALTTKAVSRSAWNIDPNRGVIGISRPSVSGWKPPIRNAANVSPQKVAARAKDIGHELTPAGGADQLSAKKNPGFSGKFQASHAEKQQELLKQGAAHGVDLAMCGDCQAFFTKEAKAQNRRLTVADPEGVWHFEPDGTVTDPSGTVTKQ